MKDFDQAELSALIDGELPAERAREIEAMIASDPALRAEFESLQRSDASFRTAARTAAFTSAVRLPAKTTQAVTPLSMVAIVLILIIVRATPAFTNGIVLGVALQVAALIAVLWSVARIAQPDAPAIG